MKYVLADLWASPTKLWCGTESALHEQQRDLIQPLDRWGLYMYLYKGIVQLDRHLYPFVPGDVLLARPGSRVRYAHSGEGLPHYWIHFDLPGKGAMVTLPTFFSLDKNDLNRFDSAVRKIWESDRRVKAFVWDFLWEISQPESHFRSNSDIYRAEEWILRNIGRPFTIKEMSKALDLSTTSLARMFQSEHRVSIKQFIRDTRIRECVRLLTTTDLPIKSIANQIGILNAQQFNKYVRNSVGLSPTKIRNMDSAEEALRFFASFLPEAID